MEIQLLTKTIISTAEAMGYKAVMGDSTKGATQFAELPALCLSHPVMRQKEGRERGVVTYRVEFALVTLAEENCRHAHSTQQIDADTEQLQTLYNNALAVIEAVDALPEVCGVACISSTPSKASITPSGDMTLKIVIDVKLKFRK